MSKIQQRLILIVALLPFQLALAQSGKVTSDSISKMIVNAVGHFTKLECDKSLLVAKKALTHAHAIKNNELIARAYNIIGLNFEEFADYQKAIGFYKKGLQYANTVDNDTLKDWLHNNLGNIYCYRKIDFKKGIAHYKKALIYSKKGNDTYEIMYTNLNIANAYFAIQDYKNGFPYLKTAEPAVHTSKEVEPKITLNSLYGSYYTFTNEFTKAEFYFKEALRLSGKDKPKFLDAQSAEVYWDISRLYAKKKEYDKAYFYLEKNNKIKDEFYNEQRTKAVKTAGLHIELDEYKRQIGKVETEKYVQEQYLKQSKIVVILFIAIFIILLLLIVTLYKNNKFKKSINSELTIANQELMIAKEKAEEASKLKSQFVSTISHELRTPLYGVVGIANMILDEHRELVNSPYINSLKFSAKYLLSLVNDILQINKIEENKIILENLTFNITDEINIVISSLQFIANKNKNKLKCEIDTAIPEFLIGDKLRLSQIFMNLISNALKFTKNGKVVISADLVKIEGKMNYIKFKIKDNGIGIAKDDQTKIFERFVQVDRKQDDYQGTGLGLSIVQSLIELFKSEIFIESKEGEGTTFKFTIAFEADSVRSNNIIKDLEVDLTSSQIFKVLVVEDNKINQMVTKKIIESNNFKCQVVDDGLTALKLLKKESFDVILMDLNMPIINGFDTALKIREIGITTPIIALTAFSKEEVIEEVIASGMNDIIIKPFEPVKLFQIIVDQINKTRNAD